MKLGRGCLVPVSCNLCSIVLEATCRRPLSELNHLPQAHPGRREGGIVFDGVQQWFRCLPRHDFLIAIGKPVA